jgi:hypothetical protein
MVHDYLWRQSCLQGIVCIECFEKAIGRLLTLNDLKTNALCNHNLPVGWFLSPLRKNNNNQIAA